MLSVRGGGGGGSAPNRIFILKSANGGDANVYVTVKDDGTLKIVDNKDVIIGGVGGDGGSITIGGRKLSSVRGGGGSSSSPNRIIILKSANGGDANVYVSVKDDGTLKIVDNKDVYIGGAGGAGGDITIGGRKLFSVRGGGGSSSSPNRIIIVKSANGGDANVVLSVKDDGTLKIVDNKDVYIGGFGGNGGSISIGASGP